MNAITTWWNIDLRRRDPPRNTLRPDGGTCFCCGKPGVPNRPGSPGWLECRNHKEGPVQWYGGARPLVLSNGGQVAAR